MDDINSTLKHLLSPDSLAQAEARGEIRHGFKLGEYHLLLQAGTYCELAARQPVCALPDCPVWFAGFINHRGHAVPIYDLACYLSPERKRTPLERAFRLLLLDAHPGTAGFIIHTLPQVLSELEPEPDTEPTELPASLSAVVSRSWHRQGQRWHEIDHRALLGRMKTEFQRSEQQ
jgi:chemotaxis signal transduction protein